MNPTEFALWNMRPGDEHAPHTPLPAPARFMVRMDGRNRRRAELKEFLGRQHWNLFRDVDGVWDLSAVPDEALEKLSAVLADMDRQIEEKPNTHFRFNVEF